MITYHKGYERIKPLLSLIQRVSVWCEGMTVQGELHSGAVVLNSFAVRCSRVCPLQLNEGGGSSAETGW